MLKLEAYGLSENSLKSKIPYSNFIRVEKWIKLFDSLITPIMTYGFQNSKLTSM
jgi:hypothetical protein